MTPLRDLPIRRKLMTLLLVACGAVLFLTSAGFAGYELYTFRRSAEQQLTTLGAVIAAESTGAVAFQNPRDATEILGALQAERHITAACLYNQQGQIFARYPVAAPDRLFPAAPLPDGVRLLGGQLTGCTPVVQVPGSPRFGTLFLSADLEEMAARLRLYGAVAAMVVVLVSATAYLLSRALQRQVSDPIIALAEAARAVSERADYSVRAAKHGEDELGLLTDSFNRMLAQIEQHSEGLESRVRERTEELELANDELEAFCSSAAHDLRTPLRAITGFADLLLDEWARIPPDQARRYIRLIRDGSQEMSQLVYALLAFSRLGRQELTRTVVDLDLVAAAAWSELAPDRGDRMIRYRAGVLGRTEGDPALLKVVLANLLSNSLKYSRPRTVAEIETGRVDSAGNKPPVYFVRDNGVGFDMRDADRLFGVFQRLHHAHEFEGTGVGLATVRRVVERHGGYVWAEGKPDGGATFYFTLPPLPPAR